MLQQTRVETVLRYWPRFVRRFPTVRHLARAREESVLAQWSGLGYYARARSLHRAAKTVAGRYGGALPSDVETLRTLPGIGRYTAGAIASIAFGVRAPVVDGNVARVLARLFAIPGDPRLPAVAARLWTLAGALVPTRGPGDWNQALMELGATLCTARAPGCERCPLRLSCEALRRGAVEKLPGRGRRPAMIDERRRVALVESAGQVLLVRRGDGPLLRGLWELPDAESARRAGFRLGANPVLTIHHTILNRRIKTVVVEARARRGAVVPSRAWRWVAPRRASSLPLSATTMKILDHRAETARERRRRPSSKKRKRGDPRATPLVSNTDSRA